MFLLIIIDYNVIAYYDSICYATYFLLSKSKNIVLQL